MRQKKAGGTGQAGLPCAVCLLPSPCELPTILLFWNLGTGQGQALLHACLSILYTIPISSTLTYIFCPTALPMSLMFSCHSPKRHSTTSNFSCLVVLILFCCLVDSCMPHLTCLLCCLVLCLIYILHSLVLYFWDWLNDMGVVSQYSLFETISVIICHVSSHLTVSILLTQCACMYILCCQESDMEW